MDSPTNGSSVAGPPGQGLRLIFAWLAVGLPLAWGVYQTLKKAAVLFR